MPGPPECVEHRHRHRAQIEERIKHHKLGVSLRHLPASDLGANRTWLLASAIALNILAMLSDLVFGPNPDERLPRRRQAKYLRWMLLCIATPSSPVDDMKCCADELRSPWLPSSLRSYRKGPASKFYDERDIFPCPPQLQAHEESRFPPANWQPALGARRLPPMHSH